MAAASQIEIPTPTSVTLYTPLMQSAFYPRLISLYTDDPRESIDRIQHSHGTWLLYTGEFLENLECWIDAVITSGVADRCIWILQPSHSYAPALTGLIQPNLYRVDDALLRLTFYQRSRPLGFNQCWNPSTGKYLFLLGKPARANRIRLLWLLDQRGLLSQAHWSLRLTDHDDQSCQDLLPELDPEQYRAWIHQHTRDIDAIQRLQITQEFHYCGYPFDPTMYQSTSFRLIAETEMSDVTHITEKTWQTMANHHPFLMSGHHGSLDYLRRLGFAVFDQQGPHAHYDLIQDDEARRNAIADNVEYWCRHIQDHANDIQLMVQHNAQQLRLVCANNVDLAQRMALHLGTDRPLATIYPLDIEHGLWREFYCNVRDDSWPDCWFREDLDHTPPEVQQECREVFGYPHSCYRVHDAVQ
jgi:hypothetical protein